jgi:hypothetical protein
MVANTCCWMSRLQQGSTAKQQGSRATAKHVSCCWVRLCRQTQEVPWHLSAQSRACAR